MRGPIRIRRPGVPRPQPPSGRRPSDRCPSVRCRACRPPSGVSRRGGAPPSADGNPENSSAVPDHARTCGRTACRSRRNREWSWSLPPKRAAVCRPCPRAAGVNVPAALLMRWLYCVQGVQALPAFKRHKPWMWKVFVSENLSTGSGLGDHARQFAASCLSAVASVLFAFSDFQRKPDSPMYSNRSTARKDEMRCCRESQLWADAGEHGRPGWPGRPGGHRHLKPRRLKSVGKNIRLWYLFGVRTLRVACGTRGGGDGFFPCGDSRVRRGTDRSGDLR